MGVDTRYEYFKTKTILEVVREEEGREGRWEEIFQLISESQVLYHYHEDQAAGPGPVRESDVMLVLAGSPLSKSIAPGSLAFRGLRKAADISYKVERGKKLS